jgi:hypothetical protein
MQRVLNECEVVKHDETVRGLVPGEPLVAKTVEVAVVPAWARVPFGRIPVKVEIIFRHVQAKTNPGLSELAIVPDQLGHTPVRRVVEHRTVVSICPPFDGLNEVAEDTTYRVPLRITLRELTGLR